MNHVSSQKHVKNLLGYSNYLHLPTLMCIDDGWRNAKHTFENVYSTEAGMYFEYRLSELIEAYRKILSMFLIPKLVSLIMTLPRLKRFIKIQNPVNEMKF
jgi:hypothetical protein